MKPVIYFPKVCREWEARISDITKMPGYLIRRLNQISVSVFTEGLARHGHDLTQVQFAVLSALKAHPGIDQATLAGLVAHDRVTIGGVIDRLEAKELVHRDVSKQDRRAKQLFLTTAGVWTFKQILPIVTELQNDVLVGLTEKEQKIMIDLMCKVTSAGNKLSRAPFVAKKAS